MMIFVIGSALCGAAQVRVFSLLSPQRGLNLLDDYLADSGPGSCGHWRRWHRLRGLGHHCRDRSQRQACKVVPSSQRYVGLLRGRGTVVGRHFQWSVLSGL